MDRWAVRGTSKGAGRRTWLLIFQTGHMWRRAWIWGSLLTSKSGALKGLAVFWRGSAEVNENQTPAADPSEVRLTLFNPPPPLPSSPSAHTLSSLSWQREEEKQENSIMPLRGRITWGDACAALPRVKSHVPSSPSALTTYFQSHPSFTP